MSGRGTGREDRGELALAAPTIAFRAPHLDTMQSIYGLTLARVAIKKEFLKKKMQLGNVNRGFYRFM